MYPKHHTSLFTLFNQLNRKKKMTNNKTSRALYGITIGMWLYTIVNLFIGCKFYGHQININDVYDTITTATLLIWSKLCLMHNISKS